MVAAGLLVVLPRTSLTLADEKPIQVFFCWGGRGAPDIAAGCFHEAQKARRSFCPHLVLLALNPGPAG